MKLLLRDQALVHLPTTVQPRASPPPHHPLRNRPHASGLRKTFWTLPALTSTSSFGARDLASLYTLHYIPLRAFTS